MGTAAFITCPHCKKDSHVGHFDWVSLVCVHCQQEVKVGEWLISIKRAAQLRVHLTGAGARHVDEIWCQCINCKAGRRAGLRPRK